MAGYAMLADLEEDTVLANSDSLLEDSDSDSNARDGCGSPSARRKKRFRKLRDSLKCRESASNEQQLEEVTYDDSLPEVALFSVNHFEAFNVRLQELIAGLAASNHLVSITSNIWGTKFRFSGLAPFLPNELGSVTYKTSLLHLQPRQMTVGIIELSSDLHTQPNDPECNAGNLSESEDEHYGNGCDSDAGSTGSNFIIPPSCMSPLSNAAAAACGGTEQLECCSLLENCASPTARPKQKSRMSSPQNITIPENPTKARHPTGSLSPLLTARVPSNLHHCQLNSSQSDRLTRVSPTEVDPYIECLLNERRSNGGQCYRLSSAATRDHSSRLLGSSAGDGCTARAVDDSPLLPSVFLLSVLNGANSSKAASAAKTASAPVEAEEQCAAKPKEGSRISDTVRQTAKNVPATTATSDSLPRWADKACQDIQFIDDDFDEKSDLYERQCSSRDAIHCTAGSGLSAREIMQSTQMLADLPLLMSQQKAVCLEPEPKPTMDSTDADGVMDSEHCQDIGHCLETDDVDVPCGIAHCNRQAPNLTQHRSDFVSGGGSESHSMVIADVPSICSFEPHKTRLILTNSPEAKPKSSSKLREMARNALCNNRSIDMLRGKRRGLCGIANPILPGGGGGATDDSIMKSSDSSDPNSPILPHKLRQQRCGSLDGRHYSTPDGVTDSLAPPPLATQSTSLPASPVHRLGSGKKQKQNKQLAGRSRLQSPLTRRRLKNNANPVDSSDDEHTMSAEEITTSENYRNLETFQKAQLNKKLRKVRTKFDSELVLEPNSSHTSPHSSPQHTTQSLGSSPTRRPKRRHFVMYNKAPMWNESSQVYQLDFGGRVTQESAKNFQIEFGGKQVMQFGRIDNNAYTLDFQYPYSAIQAFAVALANVTQRLK